MKIRLSEKRRDRLPFSILGGLIGFTALAELTRPWSIVVGVAAIAAMLWSYERALVRRDERDKMRDVAVALVRQWPEDDRADALDWVPFDILAAGAAILTVQWRAAQAGPQDGESRE